MLTLNNIVCARGERQLFQSFGITIGDCGLFVLRGANGVGKTTLLRVMANLFKPKQGDVRYANASIVGRHFEEYCNIVHFFGHKQGLKLNLSVEENLMFWSRLRKNQSLIEPALNFFDLMPYRDVAVSHLSMGWRQRVALARVLVSDADIWLLDEPFSYLDQQGCDKLKGLIQARIEQGGSVVLSMHGTPPFEGAHEIHVEDWR